MCKPFSDYQKINPNTQLMVISECIQDCFSESEINYSFTISQEWTIKNTYDKKWIQCVDFETRTYYACIR